MQRPVLAGHRTSPAPVGVSPGQRLHGARFLSPSVSAAATRANWRAEIESGNANSTTSGATDPAPPSAKSNGAGGAAGRKAAVAVAAVSTLPPPPPAAPAAADASSGSPAAAASPWTAPKPAAAGAKAATGAAKAAGAAPPPAAAKTADAPPAAQDGGNGREEPLSLPTVDVMELLTVPQNQATAFGALAGTSAILSVLCVVEPQAVLDFVLPKAYTSDLDVTFVRIVGVTLAASGAVEYSLKHAAESQLLKSATYQRLMTGCALKSVGFLTVLVANTPATFKLWSPMLWLAYAGTAIVAATINLTVISNTSGKGLVPPAADLSLPQNSASWGYTACTALYLLTVLACFTPETLFTGDPYSDVTPLVKGIWAPGFQLAAVMSYVLKDAADRDRLGASTFKNLNLGLAALEYGYSIIFGSAILSDQVDIDLPALFNLGGALLIATFALYTYATAKK